MLPNDSPADKAIDCCTPVSDYLTERQTHERGQYTFDPLIVLYILFLVLGVWMFWAVMVQTGGLG